MKGRFWTMLASRCSGSLLLVGCSTSSQQPRQAVWKVKVTVAHPGATVGQLDFEVSAYVPRIPISHFVEVETVNEPDRLV